MTVISIIRNAFSTIAKRFLILKNNSKFRKRIPKVK